MTFALAYAQHAHVIAKSAFAEDHDDGSQAKHTWLCSVFLECVDGGTLEWNAQTNKPVYFHKNITGYISAAPADDRILITNSAYNWVTVLTPEGDCPPLAFQCLPAGQSWPTRHVWCAKITLISESILKAS